MSNPATHTPPAYPMPRGCPFGPPPQYEPIRAEAPVSKVTMQDGNEAWLVTGHAQARQVLASDKISSDRFRPGFPQVLPGVQSLPFQGSLITMDPPVHSRHRRMVTNEFTLKRVKGMRPQIQRITDDCLDELLAGPRPADLVEALSLPVPSLVICELLGVPYADRGGFHSRTKAMLSRTAAPEERIANGGWLRQYIHGLVVAKETAPGEDLLSRLVAKYRESGEYDRELLTGMGLLLLVGGHETTANMISLSVVSLLDDPRLLAGLREHPERTPQLVDELLRFHSIVAHATARIVVEDFEVGGVTLRAGEGVVVSATAAGHDPEVFERPGEIDVDRGARHHLAFGYGVHQCLGQNLARLELEIVLTTLFTRIPGLALAEPVEKLPFKDDSLVYGVHRLPVTW